MKILIVDDNSVMREMTRLLLDDIGGEFFECRDGAEAIGAYESFRPDWVLMDWQMTVMDGITATREIVGSHPDAKIVIFTQFDDKELRAAAAEAGARGLFPKDDLIAIRRLMTGEH